MSFIVADLAASLGLKIDESAWKRGDALISSAKTALIGFASFEAVKGIAEAIDSTIKFGSAINDTAQKTNIGTDALQFYGYVAKQNSSSMDQLAGASVKLSKGLGEVAKTGSGPALDGLNALHLSFAAIQKVAPEDRIEMIANAFVKLGPAANKQAIAMDLFGKSGTDLIATLNDLGENYDTLHKDFTDNGELISSDQIKELDELGDNIDRTKASLGGLKNQVILALLPAIKGMVEGLQKWIKENRELIKSGIETVVNGLATAFGVLGTVIGVVVDVIKFFQAHETLAEAAILSLGLVISAFAAAAVVDWAIAFAPVLLIVGLITGVILVVNELLEAIFDGTGLFADFGRGIEEAFSAVGDAILGVFRTIGEFFTGIAETVQAVFQSVIDWISDKIDWLLDKVKGAAEYATHPWEIVSDAVGYFTGSSDDDQAASAPTRDFASRNSGSTAITYGDTHIKVDAKNADAEQVADLVDKKLQESKDKEYRDAHAALVSDDGND